MVPCEEFYALSSLACKTLNNNPGGGGPSLARELCDKLPELLDRSTSQLVALTPKATAPNTGGTFTAPAQTAPGHGPFPNLSISAGGKVQVGMLSAVPADPAP